MTPNQTTKTTMNNTNNNNNIKSGFCRYLLFMLFD